MSQTTQEKLAQVRTDIAKVAAMNPTGVMIAAIEALIEVAAGENPALRDFKKLKIYEAIWLVLVSGSLGSSNERKLFP